jgi:hypothetical protein
MTLAKSPLAEWKHSMAQVVLSKFRSDFLIAVHLLDISLTATQQ